MPQFQHARVLRLPAVLDRVGLGKSSIYALMNDGQFPRPIRLSARAVAWRETDIEQWLNERFEAQTSRPRPKLADLGGPAEYLDPEDDLEDEGEA